MKAFGIFILIILFFVSSASNAEDIECHISQDPGVYSNVDGSVISILLWESPTMVYKRVLQYQYSQGEWYGPSHKSYHSLYWGQVCNIGEWDEDDICVWLAENPGQSQDDTVLSWACAAADLAESGDLLQILSDVNWPGEYTPDGNDWTALVNSAINSEYGDPNSDLADNAFDKNINTTKEADPVYLSNGEYKLTATDLSVSGRMFSVEIVRTYGSRSEYNSQFGYGWDMNYNKKIRCLASVADEPNTIILLDGFGSRYEYFQDQADPNLYERDKDKSDYLYYKQETGYFHLVEKNGIEYAFNTNGNLSFIQDKNGNQITITYKKDVFGFAEELKPIYGKSAYFYPEGLGGPENKYGLIAEEYQIDKITDDLGRNIIFTYDSNGLLSSITDFTGRTWTYTYDPCNNNLISVGDPNSLVTSYSYDYRHNLLSITDPNGQVYITNYYNFNDKASCQEYGAGAFVFDYNEAVDTAVLTDREDYNTVTVYSDSGQVLSETIYTKDPNAEPNSFVTDYFYNSNNQMTRQIFPDGCCVDYAYNSNGDVISMFRKMSPDDVNDSNDPNVIATFYTYDDTHIHNVKSITDPLGNKTIFEYDTNGNVSKIINPTVPVYGQGDQSPTIEYTYNSHGQIETTTTPDSIVTEYVYYDDSNPYDPNCGKLWKVIVDANETDGLKITTEYAYDAYGNVRLVTDPNGDSITFQYNEINLLTKTISPLDYVTNYTYNNNKKLQQMEREIAGPNQITSYTYDILDHIKTVTDPCGYVTHYGYNLSEEPNLVIDAEDNDTISVYNERGLLTTVIDANGNTTYYTYNANGDISDINNAEGNVTNYTYDGFGRLEMITYPDDSNEQFTYDKNSNILTKANRKGEVIEYEYDAMNRLKVKNRASDPNIYYSYDIAGRIVEVNDPRSTSIGGGVTSFYYDRVGRIGEVNDIESRLIGYEYDNRGLRTKLIYPDDSNVTYEYDSMSRLKKVKYQGSVIAEYDYDELSRRTLLTLGNDANAIYEYDIADKLRKLTNNIDDVNITFTYANYDKVGNRLGMQINDANTQVYNYDNLYQLIFVDYNDGNSTSYSYDALGNRVDMNENGSVIDYTINNLNQYTDVEGTTYTYDDSGNLFNDGFYKYYYGIENRLTDVNYTSNNNPVASYEYDYQGRRVKKTVYGSPDVVTKFCYDGEQVIAEYDGNGMLLRKFIYGPGIDEPICMIDVQDNNEVYYYHFDGLGSVVALSDSAATVVEQCYYDVFGEPACISDINNPYKFTGRRYDDETGLYYYRARYYDFVDGRFLQPDPTGYEDGLNIYRYAGNSPVVFSDPTGTVKAAKWAGRQIKRGGTYAVATYAEYFSELATVTYKVGEEKRQLTISSEETLKFILLEAKISGKKITFFEYVGHGWDDGSGLAFGSSMGVTTDMLKNKYWNNLVSSAFAADARIELEGCYTAKDKSSIAYAFKEILPTASIWGYTGPGQGWPALSETHGGYLNVFGWVTSKGENEIWNDTDWIEVESKGCP